MGKPGNTGLKRIVRATGYSLSGFRHAWRYEAAFRQEIALTVAAVPLALWLGQSVIERVMLLGSLVIVLIVELLNSAIEAAIDRHGDEYNELSGRAKDLGSAAVMTGLGLAAAVWLAVALERFG